MMVLVPTTNLACYRYVASKGDGLLYAIIIGRTHYRSKSVEILAIKIQVLSASNYISVLYFILSEPITYLNNGVYWNTFGYVASSSSNCGTRQRLADCLSRTSFYLRSTYYCSKNRDTIFINCTFSPRKHL